MKHCSFIFIYLTSESAQQASTSLVDTYLNFAIIFSSTAFTLMFRYVQLWGQYRQAANTWEKPSVAVAVEEWRGRGYLLAEDE